MTNIKSQSWCWIEKGEPEKLILKDQTVRQLEEQEVLIENSYIGLNPVDWKLISSGGANWKKNHIPGVDGAGVVIKTGNKMKHIQLGTRVCYHADLNKNGSFSTHTITNGKNIIYIPEKVSDSTAAAFPCPCLTAWQSFKKVPDVVNKKVLVSGAGGSVGYFLTQLLIDAGAKVYVTSSKKHHQKFLKMGVLNAVDYNLTDWKNVLLQSINHNSFDIIFDTVSGIHATGLMNMISYYGHMVAIQDRVKENTLPAFTTCISLHEIALGAFHTYASDAQIADLMIQGEKLLNDIGNSKFHLRDLNISDFEQLPRHLAELKNNNSEIKYVIKV